MDAFVLFYQRVASPLTLTMNRAFSSYSVIARTLIPLSIDANRCSMYPISTQQDQSEDGFLLIIFGDLTILSFLICNKQVISIDPISLPFRCSLLDVSGTTLCSPLADGTVMLWELEDHHWRSVGVFELNTLRITGISIARYPTIVLGAPSPHF